MLQEEIHKEYSGWTRRAEVLPSRTQVLLPARCPTRSPSMLPPTATVQKYRHVVIVVFFHKYDLTERATLHVCHVMTHDLSRLGTTLPPHPLPLGDRVSYDPSNPALLFTQVNLVKNTSIASPTASGTPVGTLTRDTPSVALVALQVWNRNIVWS